MADRTQQTFYWGKKWQNERALYKREHPFCERCLKLGIYKPTEIVHHKEYLDDEKALDASVALNSDNLEALCFDCHNKEHFIGKRKSARRWHFESGTLVIDE